MKEVEDKKKWEVKFQLSCQILSLQADLKTQNIVQLTTFIVTLNLKNHITVHVLKMVNFFERATS